MGDKRYRPSLRSYFRMLWRIAWWALRERFGTFDACTGCRYSPITDKVICRRCGPPSWPSFWAKFPGDTPRQVVKKHLVKRVWRWIVSRVRKELEP